jgi:hypothetical protein
LTPSLFQDSEGTLASAEINDTSYKSPADFYGDETRKFWALILFISALVMVPSES